MSTRIFHLTDENGNILTDESGNQLVASISTSDYGMVAGSSDFLLHGYKTYGNAVATQLTFYLTDENGNRLTNGTDYLTAKIPVTTNLLYAGPTETRYTGG